jgi:hypothetical protein
MDKRQARELPEALQETISTFPEYKMGVHRITVELSDGRVFTEVDVAWESEIIRVGGLAKLPFDVDEIVRVWNSP